MKRIKPLILALSLSSALFIHAHAQWFEGYADAMQHARQTHTPLMLFLTQPRCHVCRDMRSDVLPDPVVAIYLQKHFVAAEVFIDDPALPKRYRMGMTPVFTFIDPDSGEIIERIEGGRTAERFLETLHSVIEDLEEEED